MSDATSTRLILFEACGALYAFAIDDVIEVLENQGRAGIPTLSRGIGGVINHHGETLPVIAPATFFEGIESERGAEHLLVLAGVGSDAGQLGVPVERVLGLVDAPVDAAPGRDWIRTRVTIDERVVAVLDAARCLERAEAQFANSVTRRDTREVSPGLEHLVHELSTGEGRL